MTTLPTLNSLAGQFWTAVLATLQQRGMLRTAGQHPNLSPRAGGDRDRPLRDFRPGYDPAGEYPARGVAGRGVAKTTLVHAGRGKGFCGALVHKSGQLGRVEV